MYFVIKASSLSLPAALDIKKSSIEKQEPLITSLTIPALQHSVIYLT
jgi:hypothetical protein